MESPESTLQGKLKAVTFTLSKTDSILEKRNKITIQRHKDSLNWMLNAIQTLKQQIEEAKFTNGESEEDVGDWGKSVEARIGQVDAKVTSLLKVIGDLETEEKARQQEEQCKLVNTTRQDQLEFERKQYELKLEFEAKIDELKNKNIMTSSIEHTEKASAAKLPMLVITKFNGTPQDWLRFWNQFEAEIDKSQVAAVTKFSYLKELVEPKVRNAIDGLPLTVEGYERAKSILKSKYGKPCEIVHAYVQNIMSLPTISGNQPKRVHEFYETLVYNVQSLETLGKLIRDINGYVRTTLDKLEGIRGDLVRNDKDWQEWDFPRLVEALRQWVERNPVSNKDDKHDSKYGYRDGRSTGYRDRAYHAKQNETKRVCVYCESAEHKSKDCTKVVSVLTGESSFKRNICALIAQVRNIWQQTAKVSQQKVGVPGDPVAELTKFGWILVSPGQGVDLSQMFLTHTSSVEYI